MEKTAKDLRAKFARKLAKRKADIEQLVAKGAKVTKPDDKLLAQMAGLALLEIALWEEEQDGLRGNPNN